MEALTTVLGTGTMRREKPMPMITDDQWRQYLRSIREKGDVSADEVAVELGCSKSYVTLIETGKRPIPVGFPARYLEAVQRIVAKRAEAVGLRVTLPHEQEKE